MHEVEMPLDEQGFLRRECPICEREFKWHGGPINGATQDDFPADRYFCPYCGEAAPADQWWTRKQVEFIQQSLLHQVIPGIEETLRESMKGIEKGGWIRTEVRSDPVNPPVPLSESNDMTAVASPCHPYEPVKIVDDWTEPIHCLVCGARYVV
jgi:hypothetical protein